MRFTAGVIRDSLGAIVGVIETLEDITEHEQSYRELNLLLELTQGITKSPDFNSAIEFVLRSVCEATDWVYGEAWIPGDDGAALECLPVWYSIFPDKMEKFRQVGEETRFPVNTGLPGRVWSSRLHEWVPDTSITSDKIFLRTRVAAETGFKAVLGVPLIAGEDFLGVLVFFDFRTYQEDNHQVELVSAVAAQLGEVIQRKYAENALLESEARLKKAEHMAQLGYWELDLVKNTLLWSDEVYRIFGLKPQEFRATYEAFLDNIHPDDRQFVNKAYTDSLKDRTTYDIVHRLILKDGTLKYVNEQCETIFDENGTPLRSTGTIQDITELKQAEERINHLNLVLQAIRNVNQLIIREKNRDDLIQQACAALIETGGYTTAWVALFDASGGFLTGAEAGFVRGFTSLLAQLKRGDLPACARSALAKAGLVEIVDPPSTCAGCPLTGIYSDKGRMAIRLEHAGEVYGVLAVSMLAKFLADEKEHALLQEIADDIAFALYSITLEDKRNQSQTELQNTLEKLQKTMDGTIQTLALTVEARDPYTAGHQRRVADLAVAIASQMSLSKEQVEGIRMAGIIHDLGKIQVPAEILSKPGKLTELEFNLIKTHPQVGFDLLKTIEFPWPIPQMVLQHHEKMDGSGYPQGLKGDEILLEARILAVADVVEAMSSHCPYRPAHGIEKALNQIKKDKGTLLDPRVVDACLKVFEQGYKLPEG